MIVPPNQTIRRAVLSVPVEMKSRLANLTFTEDRHSWDIKDLGY